MTVAAAVIVTVADKIESNAGENDPVCSQLSGSEGAIYNTPIKAHYGKQ